MMILPEEQTNVEFTTLCGTFTSAKQEWSPQTLTNPPSLEIKKNGSLEKLGENPPEYQEQRLRKQTTEHQRQQQPPSHSWNCAGWRRVFVASVWCSRSCYAMQASVSRVGSCPTPPQRLRYPPLLFLRLLLLLAFSQTTSSSCLWAHCVHSMQNTRHFIFIFKKN